MQLAVKQPFVLFYITSLLRSVVPRDVKGFIYMEKHKSPEQDLNMDLCVHSILCFREHLNTYV